MLERKVKLYRDQNETELDNDQVLDAFADNQKTYEEFKEQKLDKVNAHNYASRSQNVKNFKFDNQLTA